MFNDNNETSRAFFASNINFRNKVFSNWEEVSDVISKGPDAIKKYLVDIWNSITHDDVAEGFKLIDMKRKISKKDFEVSYTNINDIVTYYFTFPDSDFIHGQAKYVALVLTSTVPRYFMMEVSSNFATGKKSYVFGEWQTEKITDYVHINYGIFRDNTIESFAREVNIRVAKDIKKGK